MTHPIVALVDLEPQGLRVGVRDTIALTLRLNFVGVATDAKVGSRRGLEIRDCAGCTQFQASIEKLLLVSLMLTKEFHCRAYDDARHTSCSQRVAPRTDSNAVGLAPPTARSVG